MQTVMHGSISFAMVDLPIALTPATKPAARQSDISFRMLHRQCATPLRGGRWCPVHEARVDEDEIVRGWEVAKGQFVFVEDFELEAIEVWKPSGKIDVCGFVRLDEVDPVYFDRTYFLYPPPRAIRAYAILLKAMQKTRLAGLCCFVFGGRERFGLIRPAGDALALETLYFSEDVKASTEIAEQVASVQVRDEEVDLAEAILDEMTTSFDPGELRSTYRAALRDLLESKLTKGTVAPEQVHAQGQVVDLLEALRESVKASTVAKRRKPKERATRKVTPDA